MQEQPEVAEVQEQPEDSEVLPQKDAEVQEPEDLKVKEHERGAVMVQEPEHSEVLVIRTVREYQCSVIRERV